MKLTSFFQQFKSSLSGEVVALYSNQLINLLAAMMLGVFLPAFFFQRFGSLQLTFLFYLILYLLYLFLAAPGAMLASRWNFKRAMVISTIGSVVYFSSLYLFERNVLIFSVIALLGMVFNLMMYWVPYHSDFAKLTNAKTRGKTIGTLTAAAALVSIIAPAFAGFVISTYSFNVLFLIVIAISISSVFPLMFISRDTEYYTFGYWQTWQVLFHPRQRRFFITYFADGVQNACWAVIWPLFVWQLLAGDFRAVGIIFALVTLATVVLNLMIGNVTDKFDKKKLLRLGSFLYSAGWLLKIIISTVWQIFVISIYHNLVRIVVRTPFDALRYQHSIDAGDYIDEYSVLRAMALSLGYATVFIIAIFLVAALPVQYIFALAAIAALLVNFI